jgi:hypothetical protein
MVGALKSVKLLVFAHKPPPYHGQSYAVQLMLEGFGGEVRQEAVAGSRPEATASSAGAQHGIECYHIDCRFSDDFADLGRVKFKKALLIVKYCLQAIWCRLRHGAKNFYYIPAPSLRVPLYRDWVVMLLCRPFFRRTIFHGFHDDFSEKRI